MAPRIREPEVDIRRLGEVVVATQVADDADVPGLGRRENVARIAPYFSLANLGRFFNGRLDEKGEVLFEGPLNEGSSLIFYLNRKFSLVNQNSQREAPLGTAPLDIFLDQNAVLKKWSQTMKQSLNRRDFLKAAGIVVP